MQCDMCGKETNTLKAQIEGSVLEVCADCARFGKPLPRTSMPQPSPSRITRFSAPIRQPEPSYYLAIVDGYAKLIKNKRDAMCLKQEDLAKHVNEKWSVIQKIESGDLTPSLELAKKIEYFLRISLIEQRKDEDMKIEKQKSGGMTIGDLLEMSIRK